MNKKIALCCMLLLSCRPAVASLPAGPTPLDRWEAASAWDLGVTPVDFAQSPDKKLVFVLGEDGQMHVYSSAEDSNSAFGRKLGSIFPERRVMAFDIESRGKVLHLVDQDQNYMVLDISLNGETLEWAVRKTWKTDGMPANMALSPAKNMVCVLEKDSAVHVYSLDGERRGVIPVDAGTIAVEIIPNQNKLYLLDRNSVYTVLDIFL